jgi:hypothetical protein
MLPPTLSRNCTRTRWPQGRYLFEPALSGGGRSQDWRGSVKMSSVMAQNLSTALGIAVGISSGANLVGALIAQDQLGCDATVATVFPDSNKKYLSTNLMHAEPVKPGYLTPDVEFTDFDVYHRLCEMRAVNRGESATDLGITAPCVPRGA